MTYKAIVKNGSIKLPSDAHIEDGTEVEVRIRPKGTKLAELLHHAGSWDGTDADQVVDLIYHSRSSRDVPSVS